VQSAVSDPFSKTKHDQTNFRFSFFLFFQLQPNRTKQTVPFIYDPKEMSIIAHFMHTACHFN